MEVLNTLSDSVGTASRPGAAVHSATLSQTTILLKNRAGLGRSILELEVRVDFEDLGVDLLDSSVEPMNLAGSNFNFPHQWLSSVTGDTLRDSRGGNGLVIIVSCIVLYKYMMKTLHRRP